MATNDPKGNTQKRLNRRQFVQALGLTFVGGSLVACGATRFTSRPSTLDLTTHTYPILPSPQPAAGAETSTAGGKLPLEEFLALSAVLTGFDNLNPTLGARYLQSLQESGQFEAPVTETVIEVYNQAGFGTDTPPTAVEELEEAGLFDQESTRQLLDTIIETWYTGIYTTPEGEPAVATYVDALMWQALPFTKPLTICGSPNFWSDPPERALE
jgi:hypothetical protein